MKITTVQKTHITLSREDVGKIIREHLAAQNYAVESMQSLIKIVYDGSMNDPGTEEFDGYRIVANYSQKEIETNE